MKHHNMKLERVVLEAYGYFDICALYMHMSEQPINWEGSIAEKCTVFNREDFLYWRPNVQSGRTHHKFHGQL